MLDKFLNITGAPAPKGIVHVGAHHGQEIGEYQSYAPELLIWVEADPRLYTELQEYLSQYRLPGTSQWCLNAMVSDRDGAVHDFHIASNQGQASSMFPSTDTLKERYPQAVPTGEILSLPTRTLQGLLSEMEVTPEQIDYLVLDTQGAEMKCLLGAGPYLEHLRFITAEVSTTELYSGGAQMSELDEYLQVRNFLRVSGDPAYEHGNALYLRIPHQAPGISDSSVDGEFITNNRALIDKVNDVITRINGDGGSMDTTALEQEILTIHEDYIEALMNERSREINLLMARLSYDLGMESSFKVFLPLLGWTG